MKLFYSAVTGGFYSDQIHGARTLLVVDPVWTRPLIDGEQDLAAIAPTIEVSNPDCLMPPDAVEITDEQHAALLDGQSQGKRIETDINGHPVLIAPPAPTLDALKEAAQAAIDAHFEVLYSRTVANNAIASEYDAAYMAAKAWLADMTKPAPERVKALAEGYGLTDQQAAQVVVQKWLEANAVAFDLRGAARLRAKAAIRAATTAQGVADAEAAGRLAMESVTFSI